MYNNLPKKYSVAVIGGGVGGMTVAHELAERGFSVEVYEKQPEIPGGKARSIPVTGTGKNGRRDLPGEHGYRFFPRFYRHIFDTMKRIPFPGNKQGVYDNLVETSRMMFAQRHQPDVYQVTRFPRGISDFKDMFNFFQKDQYDLAPGEFDFYMGKLWSMMTACDQRRDEQWEYMSAWEFLEAESKSAGYKQMFADQARVLLAANPRLMSAKVAAKINNQLFYGAMLPGMATDNLLNGPTNEVWINPWLRYIQGLGGVYKFDAEAKSINLEEDRISSVRVNESGKERNVVADYFVFAIPVESIFRLLTPKLLTAAPSLAGINDLVKHTAWMNGIQYYLSQDPKIVHGHTYYVGTPWALTTVAQQQFWNDYDLSEYGDGTTRGILSVDISDWETEGILHKKPARECTPWEIAEEVWHQLKLWLNEDREGGDLISDDMINDWFIDTDINRDESIQDGYANKNDEPLLINVPGSWELRPEVTTEIDNLLLAADYVKTNTELTTMEAANEAGRRAVNAILAKTNLDNGRNHCRVWDLHEPSFLEPFKYLDWLKYKYKV